MTIRWGLFLATLTVAALLANSSAQAAKHAYSFTMNGASENPANASNGTGVGLAVYDDVAQTLHLKATFSGLSGNVSQTHFHATTSTSGLPDNNPAGETLSQAAAAVSNVGIAVGNTTLPGFPLGVTSGSYDRVLNLNDSSIYNVTFLGNNGNSAATAGSTFVAALAAGKTYWNIHSSAFPGGEIRAFPVPVPEPAGVLLLGMSVVGLEMARRRGA